MHIADGLECEQEAKRLAARQLLGLPTVVAAPEDCAFECCSEPERSVSSLHQKAVIFTALYTNTMEKDRFRTLTKCQVTNSRNENMSGMVRMLTSSSSPSSQQPCHQLDVESSNLEHELSQQQQPRQLRVTEDGRSLRVQTDLPHLVSLGGGRLSTTVTLLPLPDGKTMVGTAQATQPQDIVIRGAGVQDQHAYIINHDDVVTLYPLSELTSVDGIRINKPTRLSQGCMVCFGRSSYFRFNHPFEAQRLRSNIRGAVDRYSVSTADTASPSSISTVYDTPKHLKERNGDYDNVAGSNSRFAAVDRYVEQAQQHLAASEAFALATPGESNKRDAGSIDNPESSSQLYDNIEDLHQARIDYRLQQQQGQSSRSRREVNVDSVTSWQQTANGNTPTDTSSPTAENYSPYEEIVPLSRRTRVNSQAQKDFEAKSSDVVQSENNLNAAIASLQIAGAEFNGDQIGTLKKGSGRSKNATCSSSAGPSSTTPTMTAVDNKTGDEASSPLTSNAPVQDLPWNGYDNIMQLKEAIIASAAAKLAGSSGVKKPTAINREVQLPVSSSATKTTTVGDTKLKSLGNQKVASSAKTYSTTSTTTTIQADFAPPAATDSSECVEDDECGSRNRRKMTRNSGGRELTTAAHGVITEQHSTPEVENFDEGGDEKVNVSAASDRKGRGVSYDRSCRQQTDAGPAAAATHGLSSAVTAIQSAHGRVFSDDIGTPIDGDLSVNTDSKAAVRHESAVFTSKMQPNEQQENTDGKKGQVNFGEVKICELDAAIADDNDAKPTLCRADEKSRNKKSCKEKPPIGKNSNGDKQAKKQTSEPADKKKEQKVSCSAEKPEAKKKDSNSKTAQSTAAETTSSGGGKMSFFKSILTRSRSPSPKRGVTNRSPSPSPAASGTNEVSSSSSLSALKRLSDPLRVSLRQILQGGDGSSAGGKSKSAGGSTEETNANTKLAAELQQQQHSEPNCNTNAASAVANPTDLAEHVDTDKVRAEQTTKNGYFTANDVEDSGQSEDASTSSSSAGSVTLSMPALDEQSEQMQPKIQESNNATSYAAIKVSSKAASSQERRRKLPSTDAVAVEDGENPWIVNMKELNLASPNLNNFKGEKVFQKGTATTNVTLIGFDRASSSVTARSRNGTGSQQSTHVQDEVSTLSIENRSSPARSSKATSNTDVRCADVSISATNADARNSSPIYDTVYVDHESMAGTPKLPGDGQVSTVQTNKVGTESLKNVDRKSLRTDKDDTVKTAGKWEADRQSLEKSGSLPHSGGSASKNAVSTTETISAKTNHESSIVSTVRPENQPLTSAAAVPVSTSKTRPTPPRTLTAADSKRVDGVLATSSDRDQTMHEKPPRTGADSRTSSSRDGGIDEAGYNRLVEHHQTILKCSSLPSYTKSQRFDPAAIFAAFDNESAAEPATEKVDCKRDTLAALSFIDPDELSASQRDLVDLFRQQKAERQQEQEQAQREKKRWEKIETMWKEFEAQSTTSPISGGLGGKDKLSPPVKADTIDLLHRTGRHLSGGGSVGLHMATGYRSAVSQDNIYGSETLSRRTIRQPMPAHDRSLDELMDEFNTTLAQQFQGSSSKRKVSASGPDRAPSHCAVASETFSRLSSKQYNNGNDVGGGGGGLAGVRQTPGYTAGVMADGTSGARPRASSCSQRPSANVPARPRAAATATSPATAPVLGNIGGCGPGERSRSQNPLELRNDYRHVTRGGIGGMTSRSTFDLGVDYRQDNAHNGLSGDITSSSSDLDGDSNVSSSMCRLDVGCHSSGDSQKCLSENNRDFLIEEQLKLIQKQLRRKQIAIEALELERQRCLQLERRLHREMNSATRFSEESTGDLTAAAAAAAAGGGGGSDVISDDLETAIRMREKRRGSAVTPAASADEETRISSSDLTTVPGRTAVPSRPLTRYLPMRSKQFDLRHFVETSGHNLSHSAQHVEVTATACRGFLWKMAGGAFRKWNKRWFVFDRTRRSLVYYVDKIETSKAARGTIYFQSISDVFVDHLQTIRSPNPRLTFCIKTAERLLYLMAPTDETMRIWIDVVFTGAEGYQQFT